MKNPQVMLAALALSAGLLGGCSGKTDTSASGTAQTPTTNAKADSTGGGAMSGSGTGGTMNGGAGTSGSTGTGSAGGSMSSGAGGPGSPGGNSGTKGGATGTGPK